MNKEAQIAEILNDLYTIDQSLKRHEIELRKIVLNMMKAKPNIVIDEKFKENLRLEIFEKIAKKKFPWGFGRRLLIPATLLLILAFGGVYYLSDNKTATRISYVKENAFGDLKGIALNSTANTALGGRGGAERDSSTLVPSTTEPSDAVSVPANIGVGYKYLFKGELPSIPASTPVLKSTKSDLAPGNLDLWGGVFNKNLIDFGKFRNLKITRVDGYEDADYGYTIGFGSDFIDIWANGEKWGGKDQYWNVTSDQAISDEEAMNIAKGFLNNFGVNLDIYGSPEVREESVVGFVEPENEGRNLVPGFVNLIFPLKIDGKEVYYGSERTGIALTINVSLRKVSSANISLVGDLTASNYDTISREKIISTVEAGGIVSDYNNYEKSLEFKLGSPKEAFVSTNYNNDTLYIPALVFPIEKNGDSEDPYNDDIIVPLVQIGENPQTDIVPLPAKL